MTKRRDRTAERAGRSQPTPKTAEEGVTLEQALIAEATEAAKEGRLQQGGIEFQPTSPEELEDLKHVAKQYEQSLARGDRSIPITIRMRPEMVDALRAEADRVGARGYQTLLKQWIEERLRGELLISARALAAALEPLRGVIRLLEAEVGSAELAAIQKEDAVRNEAIRSAMRDLLTDDDDEELIDDTESPMGRGEPVATADEPFRASTRPEFADYLRRIFGSERQTRVRESGRLPGGIDVTEAAKAQSRDLPQGTISDPSDHAALQRTARELAVQIRLSSSRRETERLRRELERLRQLSRLARPVAVGAPAVREPETGSPQTQKRRRARRRSSSEESQDSSETSPA